MPILAILGLMACQRTVTAPEAIATPTTPTATHWQCGDLAIEAVWDATSDSLLLDVPAERLRLKPSVAASGARFGDDEVSFHQKGSDATLTYAGGHYPCHPREQASPWVVAREQGLTVRAMGQEPGWTVDVGPAPAYAVSARWRYGEAELSVPQTSATADGFITDDGRLRLTLEAARCEDVMSGIVFAWRAHLQTEGANWSGCARRFETP